MRKNPESQSSSTGWFVNKMYVAPGFAKVTLPIKSGLRFITLDLPILEFDP
jgi:hypothetical protein